MGDMDLFMAEMADVKPLKGEKLQPNIQYQLDSSLAQQRREQALVESYFARMSIVAEDVERVAPDADVSYKRQGIQQAVFKRMCNGEYPIKAELNVTGINYRQAREALVNFIIKSQSLGLRNVLVIHGTGVSSKPYPGALKSLIVDWLTHLPEVMAFHSALPHHGGKGATYLMLAKSDEMKLEAKETNHKGVGFR